MADRATLHVNRTAEFLAWCEGQGYRMKPPRGAYEVARMKGADGTAIIHYRDRGGASVTHYVVHGLSEDLMGRWLRERKAREDPRRYLEDIRRWEDSPDLFGSGIGTSTQGEQTCDLCGRVHNEGADDRARAEGDGVYDEYPSVAWTGFLGLEVAECCWGRIEESVWSRRADVAKWLRKRARIVNEACEALLKDLESDETIGVDPSEPVPCDRRAGCQYPMDHDGPCRGATKAPKVGKAELQKPSLFTRAWRAVFSRS